MTLTASYRTQHKDLAALVLQLGKLVDDAGALAAKAGEARSILAKLAGTLRVHLAMEDKNLYPRLVAHKNPALAEKARRFQTEMAPLGKAFFDYVARWPHERAVAADPAGFAAATRQVLRALTARIAAEDHDLYPAADAA